MIPNANLSFWYLPINCSNEGTFFKNDKIGKIWITDLSNYLAVWLISWEMFFLTPPLLILSHKQSELCEAYWQWKESTNLFCQIVNQISKLKIHVYLFFFFLTMSHIFFRFKIFLISILSLRWHSPENPISFKYQNISVRSEYTWAEVERDSKERVFDWRWAALGWVTSPKNISVSD